MELPKFVNQIPRMVTMVILTTFCDYFSSVHQHMFALWGRWSLCAVRIP